MKAIKIASGVAVTALAAAISAQANAAAHGGDTETSWSFTGSMEFLTVIDMAGEDVLPNNADNESVSSVIDVTLDEEDDYDAGEVGEGWGMNIGMDITHGPFSATLNIDANDQNDATVSIDDIIITDGAVSFGQVGSLVDQTLDYAYDMGDSADADGNRSEGEPVDAALRYTMDGLAVQLEGENSVEDGGYTTDGGTAGDASENFGVAAQYAGEADAVSYVAEAQVRTSSYGGEDDQVYVYVGAGATYTMDMVEAKVGVNSYSVDEDANNDANVLEYGFELTVTPVEALSVYLKGQDLDSGDTLVEDSMKVLAGASYTVGMITATAEYTYTAEEEAGDEFFGEAVYTDGPVSAYADVTLADLDAEESADPQIGAGVSYTQDNGVKYAADYDFQTDIQNMFKLSAAYAF